MWKVHVTNAPERLASALSDRYRVEREIGSGGMATVYLAEDLKHHRKVAVKVLRPELAVVLGAERFLKEIEVTAHLQHPHVLPLFDSGEADSFLYYVMPYVEGESLRQKLNREKQLSIEEAVRITEQVASALDYAHRHDVIHRDIKPENILLQDGQALVADFGIALAVRAAGGDRLTETGLSLGTPQYMSPEQATADRELDARSDVYSLACVLYEMLAGEAPYAGPTAQAVIAKVISGKPERITALRDTVPVHVEAAIHKAMAKLPADRFATAAEFASGLSDRSLTLPATGVEAHPPVLGAVQLAQRYGWLAIPVAGLLGLLAGAALMRLGKAEARPSVVRFVASVPEGTRLPHAEGTTLAVSPDGQHLVYVGEDDQGVRLFIKRVSELYATPIEGTEGARTPFFSPDGRWIGFASGGQLKRAPLEGGPVQTIVNGTSNWGADWGADGSIVYSSALGLGHVHTDGVVYSSAPGLRRVSADGGEAQQITEVSDTGYIDHLWPVIVPSGDAVLFTIHDWRRGLQGAQVAAVVLETGEVRQLIPGAFSPRLLSTGHLLFSRADGTVEAVRFDASGLELLGQPVPVVEGVQVEPAGETDLAVSQDGSVVYLPGSAMNRRLMRVDRSGRATRTM
jgi:serine/threonine-protein kinase